MKILLGAYAAAIYLLFLQSGILTVSQAIIGIAITLVLINLAIALISVALSSKKK